MSAEIGAPQQFRQSSRKGKKAWRKNVDISEVQDGLKTVRDEEILLGGVLSEKLSADLFTTDTTGSTEIQRAYLKRHKALRADEILAQRSAIPAVDSRKRSASKVTDGILPSKKARTGVSHKELNRLKHIAYHGDAVHKDVVEMDGGANCDLWAAEAPVQDEQLSFLPVERPPREPVTLKRAPVVLSASGKPFPAVRKPEAAKSYNPLFDDWAEHVEKLGEKEVGAERQRRQAAKEEQERLERIKKAMEEPEPDSAEEGAWESEWEGIQSEVEEEQLKKKRPERKTQAQRNKIKRRKEAERKALHEEKQREREKQVAHVRALQRAFEAKERARQQDLAAAQSDASSDEGEESLRRRRFGKARIPEAPLEVVLADELRDSLRLLKPEGNLLTDRFRGMMLRGKVECRKAITQPKKRRVTVTEKWSYKDWKLK